METLIMFNGVRVLLTTGNALSEVQSYLDLADAVVAVYPPLLSESGSASFPYIRLLALRDVRGTLHDEV